MPAALEDIRDRLDRGLGRAPAAVPTIESLKARIDTGMGRSTPLPRRKPSRVSENLIEAMIQAESRGDPNAVSPAGAQGLMQLMPATAAAMGVTDPLDPEQNRAGGTRYINSMFARYDDDPELALMAFNWGPGNVDRWLSKGRPPKTVPKETRAYVAKLLPVARRAEGAPTLEGLKARVDRAITSEAPSLENLRARLRAAKGLPSIPRRKPEVPGITALDQAPYTPEQPQAAYTPEPPGLGRSSLNAIVQGAAGGVAGFPEAVGIGRQAAARALLAQYDKIDRGGMPDQEHQRRASACGVRRWRRFGPLPRSPPTSLASASARAPPGLSRWRWSTRAGSRCSSVVA